MSGRARMHAGIERPMRRDRRMHAGTDARTDLHASLFRRCWSTLFSSFFGTFRGGSFLFVGCFHSIFFLERLFDPFPNESFFLLFLFLFLFLKIFFGNLCWLALYCEGKQERNCVRWRPARPTARPGSRMGCADPSARPDRVPTGRLGLWRHRPRMRVQPYGRHRRSRGRGARPPAPRHHWGTSGPASSCRPASGGRNAQARRRRRRRVVAARPP